MVHVHLLKPELCQDEYMPRRRRLPEDLITDPVRINE